MRDNILDKLSDEYKDLKNIFSISILSSVFVEGGALALEGITGLSLGATALIAIPLFIILFPDETNELWKELCYLLNPNYRDYPNITIYEGMDYNTQKLFDKSPVILVLNGQSLDEYVKFTLNDYFKNPDILSDKTRRRVESNRMKINQPNLGGSGIGPDSNDTENWWEDIGEYLKDLHDEYEIAKDNKMTLQFIRSHFWELITLSLTFETINVVDFLIKIFLFELSKESSGK